MTFSMLALVQAGEIHEDDDVLAIMQNISQENAHAVGKWLALATGGPVHLKFMTIGEVQDIEYTPEQVKTAMQRARKAQDQEKRLG